MTDDEKEKLAVWFGSFDTGASSETLAVTALCGAPHGRVSYPHDPADLGRCLRLLEKVPNVKGKSFPILAKVSKPWARLIERWDEVCHLFEQEKGPGWPRGWVAPKTYDLMQDIIYA
ncbi:MAG: hypothetical protein AAF709_21340 [Pseudomonadota bacterium]